MGFRGLFAFTAILLVAFVSTDTLARTHSPYLYENGWFENDADATLPRAIASGMVRYAILSRAKATEGLAFDFEAAAHTWFRALGYKHIAVERVRDVAAADIVLSYSPRSIITGKFGSNAHYFDSEALFETKVFPDGRRVPIIEINSQYESKELGPMPWMSIFDARKAQAHGEFRLKGVVATSIGALFGPSSDARRIAKWVLKFRPEARFRERVAVGTAAGGYANLLYVVLVHELGHAFGLGDLYPTPDNPVKTPRYNTVMSDREWRAIAPAPIDVRRVQRLINRSEHCEALLQGL